MTGRPRSSGRSRCSTAAKNASRSTWRIVRSVTVAIIDPLWKPPPTTVAGRSAPPRARRSVADRRPAAMLVLSLVRADPVGRPRLAVAVRRPGLGPRPARRAGPAAARRRRGRGRRQRLPVGPPRRRRRPASMGFGRASVLVAAVLLVARDGRSSPGPPSVARAVSAAPDPRRDRRGRSARTRRPGSSPAASASSSLVVLGRTAGARRPTAGCRAAGTGATCWSTSRSARASSTATSRPRCRTSPASR